MPTKKSRKRLSSNEKEQKPKAKKVKEKTQTFYSLKELKQLHSKAVGYDAENTKTTCFLLYRDKSLKYFQDIYRKHCGVMHTYPKDASYDRGHGDQRCPANDSDFAKRPQGLFFCPNVQKGSMGLPHPGSIYGDTRLELQIPSLLQPGKVNLFFSDFYCVQGKRHHVCIFATDPLSRTPNMKGFHNLDAWCR